MTSWKYTVIFMMMEAINARGRYEFIDEADLPAFYSMRSAQLAQKAQTPQFYQDYNPYTPYQMYQPQQQQAMVPETPALAYSPFAVYSPVYRPAAAAAPIPFPAAARASPVQYHPLAYFHGGPAALAAAQMAQSGVASPTGTAPIRKKSA